MSIGQRPPHGLTPAQWLLFMRESTMARLLGLALVAAAALVACAPVAPARSAAQAGGDPLSMHFRCDDASEFAVRFADDGAVIDAPARGSEQLLRDAGGVTPQQTVYSNGRLRAEFGLGGPGDEASLHYLSPPLPLHCVRVVAP